MSSSNRLHQEFLLEVEAVQLEQKALLRCLIKCHALKRIYFLFRFGFSVAFIHLLSEVARARFELGKLRSEGRFRVPRRIRGRIAWRAVEAADDSPGHRLIVLSDDEAADLNLRWVGPGRLGGQPGHGQDREHQNQ